MTNNLFQERANVMQKKVTFLFGSGADTDACEKMPSGRGFSKVLLKNKYGDEIRKITGINASHFRLLYPNSRKIYFQTIVSHEREARKTFNNEIVDMIKKYYLDKDDTYKSSIIAQCKTWYEDINNDTKYAEFFLEYAEFFDSLDEKFNSLRNAELYRSNANRVINAYYTVFLMLFEELYSPMSDFSWTLENIISKLREDYSVKIKEECYYKMLEKYDNFNVVTTNYTKLAEKLTGNKETIYLHGKLTWFENLKKLDVYDCDCPEDEKIIKTGDAKDWIPFILIPSGVKPLICKRQVEEFSKFVKALDESDYLVIVGYQFNSEDNHINSMIANWLRNKKGKVIYFNYEKSLDFEGITWASEFKVARKCEMKEDIIELNVDKSNALKVFEKVLSYTLGKTL